VVAATVLLVVQRPTFVTLITPAAAFRPTAPLVF